MQRSQTTPLKFSYRLLGDRAASASVIHVNPITEKGRENSERLGPQSGGGRCGTCAQDFTSCPQHLGVMETYPLPVPFVNAELVKWLKVVCAYCGRIGISQEQRITILNTKGRIDRDTINEEIKRLGGDATCPWCGNRFRIMKPVGYPMHNAFDFRRPALFYLDAPKGLAKEEIGRLKYHELPIVDNHHVLSILQQASNEDCRLMGYNPFNFHPKLFMTRYVPLAPPAARPSPSKKNKSSGNNLRKVYGLIEDYQTEISAQLGDKSLRELQAGSDSNPDAFKNLVLTIFNLYYAISVIQVGLPDNLYAAFNRLGNLGAKMIQPYLAKLSKKDGVYRQYVVGKRVNRTARTPLIGAPWAATGAITYPRSFAMKITEEHMVTELNIDWMRMLVRNGPGRYPGANGYIRNGHKYTLKERDLEMIANSLVSGDIILRHILAGDVSLHQRYPSIREESIDASILAPHDGTLIQCPISVCDKKMADFDGDDTESFKLSSFGVSAEALVLQSVLRQFIAPYDGNPCIGGSTDAEDGIDGINLLVRVLGERNLTLHEVRALFGRLFSKTEPSVIKDSYNYTDIIEELLPKDLYFDASALGIKSSDFALIGPSGAPVPPDILKKQYGVREPGDLIISGGKVIRGIVVPDAFRLPSGGAHLLKAAATTIDYYTAIILLEDVTRLAYQAFLLLGQTMGDDTRLDVESEKRIRELVDDRVKDMDEYAIQFHRGELVIPVGHDATNHFEQEEVYTYATKHGKEIFAIIKKALVGSTYEQTGYLRRFEPSLVNALGSKGQLLFNGRRPWPRLANGTRHLPYFPRGYDGADAAGYIKNPYIRRITPPDAHNSGTSDRKAVYDKGVSVQEQGYFNRQLNFSLGQVYIDHFGMVRGHSHTILDFSYGHTGADPRCSINTVVDGHLISGREFIDRYGILATTTPGGKGKARIPGKIIKNINTALFANKEEMEELIKIREDWRECLMDYGRITSNKTHTATNKVFQSPINISSILVKFHPRNNNGGGATLGENREKPISAAEAWDMLKDIDVRLASIQYGKRAGQFIHRIAADRVKAFMRIFRFTFHVSRIVSEKWGKSNLLGAIEALIGRYAIALVSPGDTVGRKATLNTSAPLTQAVLHATRGAAMMAGSTDKIVLTRSIDKLKEITGVVKTAANPVTAFMLEGNDKYSMSASRAVALQLSSIRLSDALITGTLFSIDPENIQGEACGLNKIKAWIKSLPPTAKSIYDRAVKSWFYAYFHLDSSTLLMNGVDILAIPMRINQAYGSYIGAIIPIYENENGYHLFINFSGVISIETIRFAFDSMIAGAVLHGREEFTNGSFVVYNGIPKVDEGGALINDTMYRIMFNGTNIPFLLSDTRSMIDKSTIINSDVRASESIFGIGEARFRSLEELYYEGTLSGALGRAQRKHFCILVSYMCYRGTLVYLPRFSIKTNTDVNVLEKMAFETPNEFLLSDLMSGEWHNIDSTVSAIVYGKMPPYGSNISRVRFLSQDIYPSTPETSATRVMGIIGKSAEKKTPEKKKVPIKKTPIDIAMKKKKS